MRHLAHLCDGASFNSSKQASAAAILAVALLFSMGSLALYEAYSEVVAYFCIWSPATLQDISHT